jgi:hypothetical protein
LSVANGRPAKLLEMREKMVEAARIEPDDGEPNAPEDEGSFS